MSEGSKAYLTGVGKLYKLHMVIDDCFVNSFYIIASSKDQLIDWMSKRNNEKYEIQLIDGRVEFCYGEIDLGSRDKSFAKMLDIQNIIEVEAMRSKGKESGDE